MIDYPSNDAPNRKFMTVEELFAGFEDSPAEPVEQLFTMKLSKMTDSHDITQEDLEYDALERAANGIATRDIWDFCTYWPRLLAIMARQKNKTADTTNRYSNNLIINGCIALVETMNMNDMAFFTNENERRAEDLRWREKWEPEVHRLKNVIILEWFSKLTNPEPAWDHESIDSIFATLTTFHYDDVKNLITDPIHVPLEDLQEHYAQRKQKGHSLWDLKETRTYTMWIFVKACLFFASEDSSGWPADDTFPNHDEYRRHLLNVAKVIMHGEVSTAGDFCEDVSNKDYINDYRAVIATFTDMIPRMWD